MQLLQSLSFFFFFLWLLRVLKYFQNFIWIIFYFIFWWIKIQMCSFFNIIYKFSSYLETLNLSFTFFFILLFTSTLQIHQLYPSFSFREISLLFVIFMPVLIIIYFIIIIYFDSFFSMKLLYVLFYFQSLITFNFFILLF